MCLAALPLNQTITYDDRHYMPAETREPLSNDVTWHFTSVNDKTAMRAQQMRWRAESVVPCCRCPCRRGTWRQWWTERACHLSPCRYFLAPISSATYHNSAPATHSHQPQPHWFTAPTVTPTNHTESLPPQLHPPTTLIHCPHSNTHQPHWFTAPTVTPTHHTDSLPPQSPITNHTHPLPTPSNALLLAS